MTDFACGLNSLANCIIESFRFAKNSARITDWPLIDGFIAEEEGLLVAEEEGDDDIVDDDEKGIEEEEGAAFQDSSVNSSLEIKRSGHFIIEKSAHFSENGTSFSIFKYLPSFNSISLSHDE